MHQPFVFLHSSSDGNPPYGDFHEKYISYKHETFRNRSVSFEEKRKVELNAQDIEIPETRYESYTGFFYEGFLNKNKQKTHFYQT